MQLKRGVRITNMDEFRSYLKRVNDCPFSDPCPVDALEGKIDGFKNCMNCGRKYFLEKGGNSGEV